MYQQLLNLNKDNNQTFTFQIRIAFVPEIKLELEL